MKDRGEKIRIYSVGVWNDESPPLIIFAVTLEFTPLEFETPKRARRARNARELEFTPLEFETKNIEIC